MAAEVVRGGGGPLDAAVNDVSFPVYIEGPVVKGFGRGSKQLGIPTANIAARGGSAAAADALPVGVYFGFANVAGGPVHMMATSIGWNPYFNNDVKTIEVHLMHEFPEDFYDAELRAVVVGYIRSMEVKFSGLDDLIRAIKDDIAFAAVELEKTEHLTWRDCTFLTSPSAQTDEATI